MARIRTIKPEFCTSAQVAECSKNARLLFVLMWMFCDDCGTHPANVKQLRMECFPGDDDMTLGVVKGLIDELIANGLIVEYVNGGSNYWHVTGWKHQRIDKPQPAKYPKLDDENSHIVSGELREHSKNVPESFPPERKGKERILAVAGATSKPNRKGKIPDDFTLTPERVAYLAEVHPAADAVWQFAKFRDHHASRGNLMADWDAAWRTWCRNSVEFSKTPAQGFDTRGML